MDGFGEPDAWNRTRDGFVYRGRTAPCACGRRMNRVVHNNGRDWWHCTSCCATVRLDRTVLIELRTGGDYEQELRRETLARYGKEFFGKSLREDLRPGSDDCRLTVDRPMMYGPPSWLSDTPREDDQEAGR